MAVAGSVSHALISAGRISSNPDVQIGIVKVGRDWIASTLDSGVSTGTDKLPGTPDDVVYPGGTPAIAARIAGIIIGGQARGTAAPGDHFGIMAQQIGFFQLGANRIPLTHALIPLGSTGNMAIHVV